MYMCMCVFNIHIYSTISTETLFVRESEKKYKKKMKQHEKRVQKKNKNEEYRSINDRNINLLRDQETFTKKRLSTNRSISNDS